MIRVKTAQHNSGIEYRRRGAAIVIAMLVLVVMFIMIAFITDIGYLMMSKSNAYTAVDAGSLAAAASLAEGRTAATAAVNDFMSRNGFDSQRNAAWNGEVTVEFGTWNASTSQFTATTDQTKTDAVRVTTTLNQVDSFFGRIAGKNSYAVRASAVAVKTAPLDIMLVLDLSGSMSNHGRIAALQHAAPKFVDAIEAIGGDHRIGVMGYSADPTEYDPVAEGDTGRLYSASGLVQPGGTEVGVVEHDITSDFSKLRSTVLTQSNLTADKYNGGTGTGAAVRDATHYIRNAAATRPNATKYIVLMSDGYANKPDGTADAYSVEQALIAKGQKVVIHTISLGSQADTDSLRTIAHTTGGTFFNAPGESAEQLKQTLQQAFEKAAAAASRPVLVR